MKGDWCEIQKGDTDAWSAGVRVSMSRRGHIVMNRKAHRRLGGPKAVLLLYDRINHRIGVRAANPGHRNAFKLGPKPHGARVVRAYRLLAEQAIDLPDTVEFPDARIDDDEILILDLRSARVSKRYLGCINRAKPPADPGAEHRSPPS